VCAFENSGDSEDTSVEIIVCSLLIWMGRYGRPPNEMIGTSAEDTGLD